MSSRSTKRPNPMIETHQLSASAAKVSSNGSATASNHVQHTSQPNNMPQISPKLHAARAERAFETLNLANAIRRGKRIDEVLEERGLTKNELILRLVDNAVQSSRILEVMYMDTQVQANAMGYGHPDTGLSMAEAIKLANDDMDKAREKMLQEEYGIRPEKKQ